MNEEIKEILDSFQVYEASYKLTGKKDFEITHDIISKLLYYITNLQQENEKLKEENKRIFSKVNDDELLISNAMNYAEAQDYKSRCKKTIEYINFVINHYKEQLETPIEDTYFDSDVNRKGYILSIIAYLQTILDTLNGSDKSE